MTDIRATALAVARGNAARLGLQVEFVHSDWFAGLGDLTFHLVLGNPPYLNQLESHTAVDRGVSRLLDARFGPLKQAYTDLATLFMVEAQRILRPGGRQVLVHPLAMFAAKDAGPARRRLAENGAISGLWITTEHIFDAALVFVGAICLVKGASRRSLVQRHHGNSFTAADTLPLDMDQLSAEPTWGALIADLIGVPRVDLCNPLRLGSLATTTAFPSSSYCPGAHIHYCVDSARSSSVIITIRIHFLRFIES